MPQLSNIEVHAKLVGMRSHPDRFDFVLAFVTNPRVDNVFGKHIPTHQELAI